MSEVSRPADMLAALRQAFDRSFTEAPDGAAEGLDEFLAIRVGGDGYIVRLGDIAGLMVDRKVVALPSPAPELRGIVGLRGTIVPVYDLGAFLAYPRTEANRWLLLVGRTEPIGFAFAEFDGHLQVSLPEVSAQTNAKFAREHVREALRIGEVLRPVIDLASIVEAIQRRVGSAARDLKGEAIHGS